MYKSARMEADMTQQEAAQKLFVSQTTLSRIENGHIRPSSEMVQQMAELYGASWLLKAYCTSQCSIGKACGVFEERQQTGLMKTLQVLIPALIELQQVVGKKITWGCSQVVERGTYYTGQIG